MSNMLKTHPLELTILSPLFIGAGSDAEWSPYTDFYQTDGTIDFINQETLQTALQQAPEAMDAFVTGIRNGFDKNRSRFSIDKFIRTELRLDPKDFIRRSLPIDGAIGKNHIRRFITSAGRPFIPGSSIKGAVRTAILLDCLQRADNGKKIMKEIRSMVDRSNFRDLKEFNPEALCFGKISDDPLRHLGVSDSTCLKETSISISEIKRVSLLPPRRNQANRPARADIPQWSETLLPKASLSFTISFRKPLRDTGFSCLDDQSLTGLLDLVNEQSLGIINMEIEQLGDESVNRDFKSLLNFYEELERQAPRKKSGAALIRLGGGKTWFDNTIGLALDYDQDEALLEKFLKLLRFGIWPFPSTRSVLLQHGQPSQPLGWARISAMK